MPRRILDTHVHLWPSTATSPTAHAWMTPGHFFAHRHGIAEYKAATLSSPTSSTSASASAPASASPSPLNDFIYVETDRYLPSPSPDIPNEQDELLVKKELQRWARAPLDELAFLRRIVDARPAGDGSDGFEARDAGCMQGMVIWAPFHLSPRVFGAYLALARGTLGEAAWEKVVGFRYLLQGRGALFVREMARSEDFVANVRGVGGKVFDVGVDCHRDGAEVLEGVRELVERVGSGGPRFVLDHLTKPPISPSPSTSPPSPTYTSHIQHLATRPNVSIKLSGAFNEFSPTGTPAPAELPALVAALKPYLDLAFDAFGPQRCMWGSDWPVCNVGGPVGKEGNWGLWREVVESWLEGRGVSGEEAEGVFWRAGWRVYGLGEDGEK